MNEKKIEIFFNFSIFSIFSTIFFLKLGAEEVFRSCLFNLFNATYNDDQKKSHADYIELSMQSQFNKRDLR